jgi:segregation and condensation protein B
MKRKEMEGVIEAILFTMGESVELSRIAKALEEEEETVRNVIHQMMERYEKEDRGIHIIELDNAFQMCTKAEMYDSLIQIAHMPKKHTLSDVQLETLSIIAYKQPITKVEIEAIRGVKSDHAVNKLVEYELVEEVGRLDAPGRPILFGTSENFLRSFGIGSIDELPILNQDKLDTFKQEAEEEVQMSLHLT